MWITIGVLGPVILLSTVVIIILAYRDKTSVEEGNVTEKKLRDYVPGCSMCHGTGIYIGSKSWDFCPCGGSHGS